MSKIVTATELRNNLFNLLTLVSKTGKPIYIKRGKDVKVKLEPVKDELYKEWEETKKILDKVWGMWAHRTEEEIRGPFRRANLLSTHRIRARNRRHH